MTSLHTRLPVVALAAGMMVCLSVGATRAEATGDGWQGPYAFGDKQLDQSLQALNSVIQDKYAQEDQLAELTRVRAPAFDVAAAASASPPVFASEPEAGAFGLLVSGDRSLDYGLSLFNTELALRGTELFLQVARAETAKGDAFALAAASAGLDAKMERERADLAAVRDFGDLIIGDGSLESSMAALNRWLREHEEREVRLAAAVPPVDADSFDNVMIALAISY